jgi:hypothetical protein
MTIYNFWRPGDGNQKLELVIHEYLHCFREILQGSDPSVSFSNQSPKKKISQRKLIESRKSNASRNSNVLKDTIWWTSESAVTCITCSSNVHH